MVVVPEGVDKKQSLPEASRILGISRVSLYKRIRKYNIQVNKTIRR
ncbi:MAG: hypothetical protein GY795_34625 [Desulfobacterales bacterium]|nr:hypothetical protein [Desulfobacterales bacterium]